MDPLQTQPVLKVQVGDIVNFTQEGTNVTATVMVFIDRTRVMAQSAHGNHLVDLQHDAVKVLPQD